MAFADEHSFETALIELLSTKGWEKNVIEYPTEKELLQNWANILFANNRQVDRLNDYPLTNTEMQQLIEKITQLKTPFKLNEFINGKTVSIIRDNPNDKLHFGKEVSLKIYDRMEIAAGQSRYQIVRQPKFKSKSATLRNRRGDLMLLINGMPVIHIELKKTGIPVSQACYQIEKYAHEGIFSGLFSLIQIFVAMTPEETLYFANPGPEGKFNKDFFFHWADVNNIPMHDWKSIGSTLLSIPMAHQLIGFYTIADDTDGVLKVMRSYQYYAASAISDKVSKIDWMQSHLLGGYVWHTTGSGKTMTSFKSAQLIAESQDADKVIFLVDRIELGTQSLAAYRNFANDQVSVQGTEDTVVLIAKMKSTAPADTLIVTSIQKMSRIKQDAGLNAADIQKMNSQRIVFIVDECHRSTFGEMLITIKATFPHAVFFGFTGTPILEDKKGNTTATIFGNELHRYSIADGIRDKNVLGFDPYTVLTYPDKDLRRAVALDKAKATTEEEAIQDPARAKIYYQYMQEIPMAGVMNTDGSYTKGIEDFIPSSQYTRAEHQQAVVEDILNNWTMLSHAGKFHAILATSSINEAIEYYRLFKSKKTNLKFTALFDASDADTNEKSTIFKEDGLKEIIEDYNAMFGMRFSIPLHGKFKKDVALRLAHKDPYLSIHRTPEKQLNFLIVVNQMLTGFDSKWLNTLFLDKKLEYQNIIQAFSRTNRLFGPDKPFGVIRYYRYPHSMQRNIALAVKRYSGDRPYGLFVERLPYNLEQINQIFSDISSLFKNAGIENFEKLPSDDSEKKKFAVLFKQLNEHIEAAKLQGFLWSKQHYEIEQGEGMPKLTIALLLDEPTFKALVQRYKELQKGSSTGGNEDLPYDIDTTLIEIDTDKIDSDYMNSRFEKWLKELNQPEVTEEGKRRVLDELHKTFALLSQEEQKYANIFLHDVERGDVILEKGKTFRDYVTDYITAAQNDQIYKLVSAFGLDQQKLRYIIDKAPNEANINEFGQFDDLMDSLNIQKAKAYFETNAKQSFPLYKVRMMADQIIRKFILTGILEAID